VRAYLPGDRRPGRRRPVVNDGLASFLPYVRARLADESEVPAVVLYRELVGRGYERSYPTLTARLRRLGLRSLTCDSVADQKVSDDQVDVRRTPDPAGEVAVPVPTDPPDLGPESARALLRILRNVTSGPA
jgi:hypothetical protein